MRKEKFYVELGEKVKIWRVLGNLSQEAVGRWLGIHQAAVCRIEIGQQKMEISQAIIFCKKMGIEIQRLLSDEPVVIEAERAAELEKSVIGRALLGSRFIVIEGAQS